MNTDDFLPVSGSDPAVLSDPVSSGDAPSGDASGDALPGPVEDISSGDLSSGSGFVPVSSGDSGAGAAPAETVAEVNIVPEGFYTDLLIEVKAINYLISALLFFTVFVWVESKVRSIVRKVMKHE